MSSSFIQPVILCDDASRADFAPDDFLTLGEVARYLRLDQDHRDGVSAVRFLIRTRKIKAVKVGKPWRIKRCWVDAYVESAAIEPLALGARR